MPAPKTSTKKNAAPPPIPTRAPAVAAPQRGALKAGQAAEYLSVSRHQLYRYLAAPDPVDRIPSVRVGKLRLFRVLDLDAWLAAHLDVQEAS